MIIVITPHLDLAAFALALPGPRHSVPSVRATSEHAPEKGARREDELSEHRSTEAGVESSCRCWIAGQALAQTGVCRLQTPVRANQSML